MKPSYLSRLKKSDPEAYEKTIAERVNKKLSIQNDSDPKVEAYQSPAMKLQLSKKNKKTLMDEVVSEFSDVGKNTLVVGPGLNQGGADYQLALANLEQDKKALKGKSLTEKLAYKREAAPRYLDFLTAYINSGRRYYNEVLVTIGLWFLDIDEPAKGLTFLEVAINQQQPAPKGFSRTLEEILSGSVMDWADKENKAKRNASPYMERVAQAVFDGRYTLGSLKVISGIYRQAAINFELADDLDNALVWYQRCKDANPEKHGIKTRLEKLQARIAKRDKVPDQA